MCYILRYSKTTPKNFHRTIEGGSARQAQGMGHETPDLRVASSSSPLGIEIT